MMRMMMTKMNIDLSGEKFPIFLTQNLMEGKLLQLFGKTHLAKGSATAYTTTMGGKIKLGYEVMVDGMDSSDGSRQGRADIQRMLISAGGISGDEHDENEEEDEDRFIS